MRKTIAKHDAVMGGAPLRDRLLKGARLVMAYALAMGLSYFFSRRTHADLDSPGIVSLTTGVALWACVSESARSTFLALRDIFLLVLTATGAAAICFWLSPHLVYQGRSVAEILLVVGAFFVAYPRVYGSLAAGLGSQFYIGLLLAYGARRHIGRLSDFVLVFALALMASMVPQLLRARTSGESVPSPAVREGGGSRRMRACLLGLLAAAPALLVIVIAHRFHLRESAWGVTATAYVVAAETAGTADRIRRRLIGTAVGVPLGLLFLLMGAHVHVMLWGAAAAGLIVYAVALPDHYDFACGAYAFVLMLTMIEGGERSIDLLAARFYETLLGGALSVAGIGLLVLSRKSSRRHAAAFDSDGA